MRQDNVGVRHDNVGVPQQKNDKENDNDSSDEEKMVICDTAPKSQEKGEGHLNLSLEIFNDRNQNCSFYLH